MHVDPGGGRGSVNFFRNCATYGCRLPISPAMKKTLEDLGLYRLFGERIEPANDTRRDREGDGDGDGARRPAHRVEDPWIAKLTRDVERLAPAFKLPWQ